MPELTPVARRALRARAHHLRPVVTVGAGGLTPAVLEEIDARLKRHELIKVRVAGERREERETLIGSICSALDARPVQHIGRILVLYRENPGEPVPGAPPRASRDSGKRHTKRSHRMPQKARSSST